MNSLNRDRGGRMTFKEILKQCRNMLKPVDYSWEEINGLVNKRIYELSCYCVDPACHKKFKSPVGVRIHQAKIHGWTKKMEELAISEAVKKYKEPL